LSDYRGFNVSFMASLVPNQQSVAERQNYAIFAVFFFYAMFFPTFFSVLGSSGVFVVNGLLLVLMPLFLLLRRKTLLRLFSMCPREALYFPAAMTLFIVHLPIAMLIGLLYGNIDLTFRDFFEYYRPVFYVLTFVVAFIVFSHTSYLEKFETTLVFCFIGIAAFGLNHFLGVVDPLTELYTKEKNILSRRVSTPFINPYDFAFIMSFFIVYFLSKFLFAKKFGLLLLASMLLFFLPQSKSIAVALLFSLGVLFPILMTLFCFRLRSMTVSMSLMKYFFLALVAIFLFALSFSFLLENFAYLVNQFVILLDGGGVGRSANIRLEQFLFAMDKAALHPLILLFGNGPAKGEMEFVESIYNYQFYRYGLVGAILYFAFPLLVSTIFLWKILKAIGRQHSRFPLFFSLFIWLLMLPISSIGNNFTEQVRSSFFFYSILGIIAATHFYLRKRRCLPE